MVITGKHKPKKRLRFRAYGAETMMMGDNLPYGDFLPNPMQTEKMPASDDVTLQQWPLPETDELETTAMSAAAPSQQGPLSETDEWEAALATPDDAPLQQGPLSEIDEWETAPITPDDAPLQQEPLPGIDGMEAAAAIDDGDKTGRYMKIRGTDIVIDTKSGISVEDQRKIISQINGITEKKRRALSAEAETREGEGADSGKGFKATKNGGLFPILVNFLAIAALVGGLYALRFFQSEIYVHAREGTRVFNSTERAIIEEIRRETNDLLLTKDREIAILTFLLADVEAQMSELIAGAEVFTPEQVTAYERLRERQEVLHEALALAREERSRILNDARTQEAVLHAQFDTRLQIETQMQEFAAIGEAPTAEQIAAYEQLRSQQEELYAALVLAREERAVILGEARRQEAELQAQLDERARVEERLQGFIDGIEAWTPERQAAYEQLRDQQEELREALAQAWEEHSHVLDEARVREAELQARLEAQIREYDPRAYAPDPELEAVHEELARISHEQTQVERMEALIASLFASGHRQVVENRFHEAEESIRSLRGIINDPAFQAIRTVQPRREFYVQATYTLEALLEKNRATHAVVIAGMLQQERDVELMPLDEADLPDGAVELRLLGEIARLEGELAARDNIINNMDVEGADVAQIAARFENTIDTLQSTNAALTSQVSNLQSTNATLNSQVSNLQSSNAALNSQVSGLQSTNGALTSQVNTLQSANTSLQSTNTTLNSQVGALQSTNATLNSQVGNMQSANTTLSSQINTLQENLNTQTHIVNNLRQETQSLRTRNASLNNQLARLQQALLDQ